MFATNKRTILMTDKEQFIQDWLQRNPQDDETDAVEAWKLEVKFLNTFNDWDSGKYYD
jgi:hypothetical protein